MFTWERLISNALHVVRLDRIRGKVLVFAMMATLIPSLTLGLQSYGLNKRIITERISEEVRNATFQVVRELDLWLKERLYETRVFASSYEVVENIDRIRATVASGRPDEARARLTQYLQSVQAKFGDYEELLVIATRRRPCSRPAPSARTRRTCRPTGSGTPRRTRWRWARSTSTRSGRRRR